jgi:hypothetical protein
VKDKVPSPYASARARSAQPLGAIPSLPKSFAPPIAAAALALLLCGCNQLNESTAPLRFGSRYTADFPSPPSCTQAEVDIPLGKATREVCTHFNEKLGRGYSAEIVTFPRIDSDVFANEILLAAAMGAASSTDSGIATKDFTKVGPFAVLDVTLYPRTKGYVAFSRYILADNDLITITADGYETQAIPPDASSFLLSARVLP